MNIPDAAVQAALEAWPRSGVPYDFPIVMKSALTAALPHLPLGYEVPEGWQLVPKEPTFEMAKAAIDLDPKSDLDAKYKAMMSAVPQVATKPVDVAAVREAGFREGVKSSAKVARQYGDMKEQGKWDAAYQISYEIDALSAEPAQGEQWRDMKDAPRTGEEIIYLTKYGEIGFCKYTLAMSDDEDDLWWDFQSDADVYPQYWLPRASLPAAPTSEAEA